MIAIRRGSVVRKSTHPVNPSCLRFDNHDPPLPEGLKNRPSNRWATESATGWDLLKSLMYWWEISLCLSEMEGAGVSEKCSRESRPKWSWMAASTFQRCLSRIAMHVLTSSIPDNSCDTNKKKPDQWNPAFAYLFVILFYFILTATFDVLNTSLNQIINTWNWTNFSVCSGVNSVSILQKRNSFILLKKNKIIQYTSIRNDSSKISTQIQLTASWWVK